MKKTVIILVTITILLIPITHKVCGAVANDALPKPHAVGKGNMYYLSYDESVRYAKNFDNHSQGVNLFGMDLIQLINNVSGANTLKYRAQMAVANGFGVCWRSGSCTKGVKAINIGIVMIVGPIHRQRAINHRFVFQKMAFQLSGTAQCHIIVFQRPFMVGGHARLRRHQLWC